jgi:glycosyltransferase involved in cell wall biosynthesis
MSDYIIITPVRNEEPHIATTIASVARQTLLPVQWLVVDDNSTDSTPAILAKAVKSHPWIKVLRKYGTGRHSFASVVESIELGFATLRNIKARYVALLDADVELPPDYYQAVIERMESAPRLGLAGGMVLDPGARPPRRVWNPLDVPGAVQVFKRECYEKVRPLVAIPEGGWDTLTCLKARMVGYQTLLFTDLIVLHLKPRNAYVYGKWRRFWETGVRDYVLGYTLWFELLKCIARCMAPPYWTGAVSRLAGYCSAALQKKPRAIPDELRCFLRREHKQRLSRLIKLARGSVTGRSCP